MIAIHELRKQYGPFTAVDGVDLDVTPESTPILVGREAAADVPPAVANLPRPRESRWCLSCFLGGHE